MPAEPLDAENYFLETVEPGGCLSDLEESFVDCVVTLARPGDLAVSAIEAPEPPGRPKTALPPMITAAHATGDVRVRVELTSPVGDDDFHPGIGVTYDDVSGKHHEDDALFPEPPVKLLALYFNGASAVYFLVPPPKSAAERRRCPKVAIVSDVDWRGALRPSMAKLCALDRVHLDVTVKHAGPLRIYAVPGVAMKAADLAALPMPVEAVARIAEETPSRPGKYETELQDAALAGACKSASPASPYVPVFVGPSNLVWLPCYVPADDAGDCKSFMATPDGTAAYAEDAFWVEPYE
jgi:hypothetical protein